MKDKKDGSSDAAARGLAGLATATIDTSQQALEGVREATRQGDLAEARRQVREGLETLRTLDETSRRAGIDLANEAWETVRITAEGWEIVKKPSVIFCRRPGMQTLPYPSRDGKVETLKMLLNPKSETDWILSVAWLLGAFRGKGPFPILYHLGEQDSGKSSTTRVMRSIIDPNKAPLRTAPRDERDLYVAASNSYCLAFDNFSHLPVWVSDALCRLSTGGGFSTRQLYTDVGEIHINVQRPVLINSIEEIATRGDLLSRTLILSHTPLSDRDRITEDDFCAWFSEDLPRILGALLDVVVVALRNYPKIRPEGLPRMADFARWVTAAEPQLGWPTRTFLAAYKENKDSMNMLPLDASYLTEPIQRLLEREDWSGTAKELMARLVQGGGPNASRKPGWPADPSALGGSLRRLAPNLRAIGIQVEFWRESGGNREAFLEAERDEGRRGTVGTGKNGTSAETFSRSTFVHRLHSNHGSMFFDARAAIAAAPHRKVRFRDLRGSMSPCAKIHEIRRPRRPMASHVDTESMFSELRPPKLASIAHLSTQLDGFRPVVGVLRRPSPVARMGCRRSQPLTRGSR